MSETIETCERPSRGRYVSGCRCPGCKEANRAYQTRWSRRARKKGQLATPYVGATETRQARERVRCLMGSGIPLKAISAATGVTRSALRVLLGLEPCTHPSRRTNGSLVETKRMSRKNYFAIMECEMFDVADGALVSARQTVRIVHEAHRLGLPVRTIARICGISPSTAYHLSHMEDDTDELIIARTARRVKTNLAKYLQACGMGVSCHG